MPGTVYDSSMDTDETPLPAHKPVFLRRVQIRGYKSIAFCDVTLEPLTILVGRNASGKSNFLDALGFLRDVVTGGIDNAVSLHGGPESIAHGRRLPGSIEIAVECRLPEGAVAFYSLGLTVDIDKNVRIVTENGEITNPQGVVENILASTNGMGEITQEFGRRKIEIKSTNGALLGMIPSPLHTLAGLLRCICIYSFDPFQMRQPQKSSQPRLLDQGGRNLAEVIQLTQNTDPYIVERIGRFFSTIVPNIRFSRIEDVGGYKVLKFKEAYPARTECDAATMSDGTMAALGALTAIFQNLQDVFKPSLVAIEEPENALHPAALRALVAAFDAATMGTQILLTTHSPALLDSEDIKPENVRVVEMIDGATVIGPVDEASVEIVHRNLDSLGGLERDGILHPDEDDRDRQGKLAAVAAGGR